jgi:hypothetical protein
VAPITYPGGKRFAFVICDDTDMSRVETVAPVYRFLEELGIRAAKSVWPLANHGPRSIYDISHTLADPEYRAFIVDLKRRGFEITFHGAGMGTSSREQVIAALRTYEEVVGEPPRVHTNHAQNRDNLYWGAGRVDNPLVQWVLRRDGLPADHYLGHVPGSPYYWGDLCAAHVSYVRNLTFDRLNLLSINPSMPYHDPTRPEVRYWFSAAEADDVFEFNDLLREDRQEALEYRGGACIVATHLGKKFAVDGRVNPETQALLTRLARRAGWFPNLSELLDFLREERGVGNDRLRSGEWSAMQWTYLRDVFRQKDAQRRRHAARRKLARAATAAGERS